MGPGAHIKHKSRSLKIQCLYGLMVLVKAKFSPCDMMAVNNMNEWRKEGRNIISALETGETTPLGVVRTLKVGKEWRNDEDGRRHSRKGKQKTQNGRTPGLLEGYEQSCTAGVKDPCWGTEIEVRKGNWGTPQTPGWETLSLEISEQGSNKSRGGEGPRQGTVPKHPRRPWGPERLEVCDQRGDLAPPPGLMCSGHAVPLLSLQYASLSCLGSCESACALTTLLRAGSSVSKLPVLKGPLLTASPVTLYPGALRVPFLHGRLWSHITC